MRTHIGGYRDGEEWPSVGETIDVPDHEAASLIANGYAEEVNHAGEPEQAAGADSDPSTGDDSDEAAAVASGEASDEDGEPAPAELNVEPVASDEDGEPAVVAPSKPSPKPKPANKRS